MVRILVQVFGANAVVLAFDHVAQAAKEAFHHIRVLAVVAVDFGMVHAVDHPAIMLRNPRVRAVWDMLARHLLA